MEPEEVDLYVDVGAEVALEVDDAGAALVVEDADSVALVADEGDEVTWSESEHVSYVPSAEPYSGPYEVTPTTSEQTLATLGHVMAHDVTVAPIPSNYGLITYNGSTITVS